MRFFGFAQNDSHLQVYNGMWGRFAAKPQTYPTSRQQLADCHFERSEKSQKSTPCKNLPDTNDFKISFCDLVPLWLKLFIPEFTFANSVGKINQEPDSHPND
jgi:hypothetical protein